MSRQTVIQYIENGVKDSKFLNITGTILLYFLQPTNLI